MANNNIDINLRYIPLELYKPTLEWYNSSFTIW